MRLKAIKAIVTFDISEDVNDVEILTLIEQLKGKRIQVNNLNGTIEEVELLQKKARTKGTNEKMIADPLKDL